MNLMLSLYANSPAYCRLCLLAIIAVFVTACDQAPSNQNIFVNPSENTQFDADEGTIVLSSLSDRTVCYTTDSSTPGFDDGNCNVGSTQIYTGGIDIMCGINESGTSVSKEVQLAFEWEQGASINIENRTALFFLNCDAIDPNIDTDGDGIPDVNDNCPGDVNPNQDDEDDDGIGDLCDTDMDNDGIADDTDNCPTIPNTDQDDTDNDSLGDACDSDLDNDGIDKSSLICQQARW